MARPVVYTLKVSSFSQFIYGGSTGKGSGKRANVRLFQFINPEGTSEGAFCDIIFWDEGVEVPADSFDNDFYTCNLPVSQLKNIADMLKTPDQIEVSWYPDEKSVGIKRNTSFVFDFAQIKK